MALFFCLAVEIREETTYRCYCLEYRNRFRQQQQEKKRSMEPSSRIREIVSKLALVLLYRIQRKVPAAATREETLMEPDARIRNRIKICTSVVI